MIVLDAHPPHIRHHTYPDRGATRMLDVRTWWLEGHLLLPERWAYRRSADGSLDYGELSRLALVSNAYHRHTRWVRWSWWSYVLGRRDRGNKRTPFRTVVWCRLRGHPRGEVYFNAGGMEPDHSCKDCGEQIA